MTTQATWHEHVVGDLLTFSAPGPLTSADVQGMDSAVGEWHGDGLVVRTDYGLFVDQLNRYQGRSHLQQFEESIDQVPARIVSFDQPDGSHFTAVHFPAVPSSGPPPQKLTLVVIGTGQKTGADALHIVRSIRFRR